MAFETFQLKYFATYIENHTGIQYSDTNYFQLEHRLREITSQLGLKNDDELWALAQEGISGQFKDLLLDLATNNETSFFRDLGVFRGLTELLVPDILKQIGLSKINIWSAASSTGQEVYSIIIAIEEAIEKNAFKTNYSILATDISERVLKKAQAGFYTQLEIQRGLSAKQMVSYFTKSADNNWQALPKIQQKVQFRKLNLIESFGNIGPFDIIFCRNVLIYQSVENKKKIVQEIKKVLKPGGFLILGAAESLLNISDSFTQVEHNKTIFYKYL